MPVSSYPGAELKLFAGAVNWKAYWKGQVVPYLGGDVLEVGAGIGANTVLLRDDSQGRWTCLEPDPTLVAQLHLTLADGLRDLPCDVITGTLEDVAPLPQFDVILYLDVLEHIKDDQRELREATLRLRPGGHLVVLAPAHEGLYSAFDAAIGHVRRYSKRTLAGAVPDRMARVRLVYLDAAGLVLSLGNRLLLRQSLPTRAQIGVWDRFLVPCSRMIDPVLGYAVGKSVLGVWRRPT